MKRRYTALRITTCLPLLLLGFLPYMPNPFAWQYHLDGTPSRYGSPYELVLYLLISSAIGWGCYHWLNSKKERKASGDPVRNDRFISVMTTIGLVILDAFYLWTLLKGIRHDAGVTAAEISMILRLMLGAVGILLMVYGNQMPRTSYGSGFGFKNTFSMTSEKAWLYTQRWVGALMMLCGAVIILIHAFVRPFRPAVTFLIPILGLVAGSYILSYLAWLKTDTK